MAPIDVQALSAELELASFQQRQALVQRVVQAADARLLAEIAKLLGHSVEAVRVGAIEILEAARFRPALRHLAAVTLQRGGEERAFAARAVAALATEQDRVLVEPLVRAWQSKHDPYLDLHAETAWAKLGNAPPGNVPPGSEERPVRPVVPVPIAGITSTDPEVRKLAIRSTLASLDQPERVVVDGLFDTRHPGVRLDLVNALELLGAEAMANVLPRLMKEGERDLLALIARAFLRRMRELPVDRVAAVRSALEYGRGRTANDQLARDAIDECLRALGRLG